MSERDDRAAWLIPTEELHKRFGTPPPMDFTPLTEAEKDQLRARLNGPEGSKIGLKAREWEAWNAMTVVREPEQIAALVIDVRASKTDEYGEGILQAVAWATGVVQQAPLSGRVPESGGLPTVGEMEREQRDARDRMSTANYLPGKPYGFTVGVEACLMWLCASCDDPPW